MATLYSVQWGDSPYIVVTGEAFVQNRTATSVQVLLRHHVSAVSGSNYYGFYINIEPVVNGAGQGYVQIKGNSPNKWTSPIVNDFGWYTIGVSAAQTSIQCGFNITTNSGWGTSSYRGTVTFPVGWTSIGTPGTPSVSVPWSETNLGFSWSAASGGTNNPVGGYNVQVQSSSNGINWSTIVDTSTGLTRSYTLSLSSQNRGYFFRARVRAIGTYNTSAFTGYSSYGRKNYAPNTASIASPANGAIHPVSSNSLTFNNATDPGGNNYSDGLLRYRYILQHGSSFGNTVTGSTASTTSRTISWSSYVGQTIRLRGQTYDGWVYSSESGYNTVRIGANMTVAAPSVNTTSLSDVTTLTIPAAYVDGSYRLYNVVEYFNIYFSFDNSNWILLTNNPTRHSSGSMSTSYVLGNVLHWIFNIRPNEMLTNRTVYFKSIHSAGHLNTESAVRSIQYRVPTASKSLSKPDNSTTYKYPMNNTIPITETSFLTTVSISNWTTGNNGAYTIQIKDVNESSWRDILTVNLTANTSNSHTFNLSDVGILIGRTYEIRLVVNLQLSLGTRTMIVENIEWTASNQLATDKNKIAYRAIPNVSAKIIGEQPNLIRNDTLPNRDGLSYSLSWDINKAYIVESCKMDIIDEGITSTIIDNNPPIQLFSTTSSELNYPNSFVELLDTPNSDKTWSVVRGQVTSSIIEASLKNYVRGNATNIKVTYTFVIREIFRNNATATTPNNSYRSGNAQTLTFSVIRNTVCAPKFLNGAIGYQRTLD